MKFDVTQIPKAIGTKITNTAGLNGLAIREHLPEVYGVAGGVCLFGAVVTAVIAGRKHDKVLEDHVARVEAAKADYILPEEKVDPETGEIIEPVSSNEAKVAKSEKEVKKAVAHEYRVTLFEFIKIYGPTTSCVALCAFFFLKMHNTQAKTISGVTGAYTGLQEYIKAYENRNIELNGEESHKMCKYGYKEIEVEEEDPDNGEVYKVKKKVPKEAADIVKEAESECTELDIFHDQFHTFGRQTATMYKGVPVYDLMTLDCAESYLNDLLEIRGWVVVNDALDQLGMERTDEGRDEGWVKGCGERISLGHRDSINNAAMSGKPNEVYILDFNIHGNVNALRKVVQKRKGVTNA